MRVIPYAFAVDTLLLLSVLVPSSACAAVVPRCPPRSPRFPDLCALSVFQFSCLLTQCRLILAMQNWTPTTSDYNAATVTSLCPHTVAATFAHLPDTQVDTQANPNTTSLDSDTGLPIAQAPASNELTESDMELLAACELQDAFTYSTTTPTPCSNHDELLLNEISCNDYEPTPTPQEFKEANMLSLEQWLSKTIPEYSALYPAAPPLDSSHELSLITHYIRDIASLSALTIIEPPNMWLYFATEYLSAASLLHIIRCRAREYQPYVWNARHRAYIARREAAAMDKYIDQYDRQAFLTKHRANLTIQQPPTGSITHSALAP